MTGPDARVCSAERHAALVTAEDFVIYAAGGECLNPRVTIKPRSTKVELCSEWTSEHPGTPLCLTCIARAALARLEATR